LPAPSPPSSAWSSAPSWSLPSTSVPVAGATEKQRRIDGATTLHDDARTLYQQGEYRAAIVRLEAAVALDPDGKELIYNLAVIHEKLGEIEAAERYYRRYLEMEVQPKEREQVEAVLKRLQGAKRELAKPPPKAVRSAPVPAPAQRTVRAMKSPAGQGGRPIGPWVVVTGGLAAGAFVIANVFAALALAQYPGSDAETDRDISLAAADAAHRSAIIADVALLVAGVSGGATLYLYLTTPPRISAPSAPPVHFSARGPWTTACPIAGGLPPDRLRGGGGDPLVGVSLGAGGARLQVRF
jgi:tetratricopeptide (TPR) repeat protein